MRECLYHIFIQFQTTKPGIYRGKIERPMRIVDPDQEEYSGLVRVGVECKCYFIVCCLVIPPPPKKNSTVELKSLYRAALIMLDSVHQVLVSLGHNRFK